MKIDIPVSQPYSVDIAPGLLDDLGRYVSSGTAALVVTEEHVAPLLLERACRALRAAGVRAVPAVLPAGEETKSLAQYAALLHKLAEAGLTRADTVVALGGGVIGDLAGAARNHVDEQIAIGNVTVELAHSGIQHHNILLPICRCAALILYCIRE